MRFYLWSRKIVFTAIANRHISPTLSWEPQIYACVWLVLSLRTCALLSMLKSFFRSLLHESQYCFILAHPEVIFYRKVKNTQAATSKRSPQVATDDTGNPVTSLCPPTADIFCGDHEGTVIEMVNFLELWLGAPQCYFWKLHTYLWYIMVIFTLPHKEGGYRLNVSYNLVFLKHAGWIRVVSMSMATGLFTGAQATYQCYITKENDTLCENHEEKAFDAVLVRFPDSCCLFCFGLNVT